MFIYESRFLRRGEVWFDNEPNGARVDWILYRNRSGRVPGAQWRFFYNRLIDLSKTPEELLADLSPKTAAKIRAASKQDGVYWERSDLHEGNVLEDIGRMWNSSLESKRRWGALNREWLDEMIRARMFELVVACDPAGAPLVYAGFFRDLTRVQQLMSVSPPRAGLTPESRARTNRASCYLLWNTMLHLRKEGIRWFDFGGWYPGTEDIQLLGANAYKQGFGGKVVREFECEQVVTLKGWAVLTTARLLAKARQFRLRELLQREESANVAPA